VPKISEGVMLKLLLIFNVKVSCVVEEEKSHLIVQEESGSRFFLTAGSGKIFPGSVSKR